MGYDKQSFLAGITVGTQLKGWACYPSELLSRIEWKAMRLRTPPTTVAEFIAAPSPALVLPGLDFILVTSFSEVT